MAEAKGPPPKNSPQWIKNEKIINETPYLRAARDRAEGFTPGSGRISTRIPSQAYKDGWDAIFGKRDKTDD